MNMKRAWTLGESWSLRRLWAGQNTDIAQTVNKMAWPVVVENLLQTLLGVVDLILVGALGAAALAGVGTALQLLWVIQSGFAAITTGATVLVSHAIGAQQPDEANHTLKQSLLVGATISLIVGVVGSLFAQPLMQLIGGEPDVVAAGVVFFSISAVTSFFLLTMFIAGAAMRGAGDSKTPMQVTLVTNVLNAVLAWALIFGHLGFPALGVAGSAWGTGIARGVGAMIMVGLLLRGHGPLKLEVSGRWLPDLGLLKRIMNIGVPSSIEMMMMSGGMLIYGIFAIRLGTDIYAAQRITLNIISFSFMPGLGYAIAATALTGQALGAKDPERAKQITNYASFSAMMFMSLISLVLAAFGPWIMRVYTSEPQLIAIGADALKVLAFSQPFFGLGQVLTGSLRGTGDTRFAMMATAASIWLIRLPLAWLFGPVMHLSLAMIYLSNVIDSVARLALVWRRWKEGKWETMKV